MIWWYLVGTGAVGVTCWTLGARLTARELVKTQNENRRLRDDLLAFGLRELEYRRKRWARPHK